MIRNPFTAAWSLVTGLVVTLKEAFRPKVTIRYPHESVPVAPAYRGPVRLVEDDETHDHKCIACLACQRICPTKAIPVLTVEKGEVRKNEPGEFVIDDALCCYCGLCVEVCPTDALEHGRVADRVSADKTIFRRTIVRDHKLTDDNHPYEKKK